jgi:hypothetical protein
VLGHVLGQPELGPDASPHVTTVVLVSVASPADLVELVDSFAVAHPDRVEIADGRSARSAAPAIDLSIIEDDSEQPQAKHTNRNER